jgi:uridine phosphorylase
VSHNPYVVKCSENLLQKFGGAFIRGNTITAPGFYAPQGRQLRIPVSYPKFLDQVTYFNFKDHWLTNFEMETSMLYGMARMLGHEAISINAILGNRVKKRFTKDPYEPVDAIIKKVLEML